LRWKSCLAGRSCATHSQVNEPHLFELRVNRDAFRGSPRPLTAAAKMPRQTFPNEAADVPEGTPAISRSVVVGPPFEMTIDLPNQFRQRLEAAFLVDHPSPPPPHPAIVRSAAAHFRPLRASARKPSAYRAVCCRSSLPCPRHISCTGLCSGSPRRTPPLFVNISSRRVSGFGISGGLAVLDLCNEADSGSLALRLAGSIHGASLPRLLASPSASLHAGYSVGMMNTFQFIGLVGGARAPE